MKQDGAGKVSWAGGSNWKLNLMFPSSVGAVTKVLVKASEWPGTSKYVEVFPDLPCLESSTRKSMERSRLGGASPAFPIHSCSDGSQHQVIRCDVI